MNPPMPLSIILPARNEALALSALLFSAAIIVFLIGLISEQITALNYRDRGWRYYHMHMKLFISCDRSC